MGRDAAAVAHDVGALLHVPAALATVSVPVALLAGDSHAVVPLAGTAVAVGGVGSVLVRRYRHVRAEHDWPAVEVVALGWLLSGLVAAGVLFLLGLTAPSGATDVAFRDPGNALFEGMSGITSTGLTMVGGQEADLTATAQWWRSVTQWVGGVGMVLFALVFGRAATGMRTLYRAEGRHRDLPGGMSGTVRQTGAIYLGLTVAAVAVLSATEHDPWTALNHGLTGISTGGFNVTGTSLAGYGAATQLVMAVVITVGAVTFVAHHVLLVQRDLRHWWQLTPVRAQAAVLVGGAVLLVVVQQVTDAEVPVLDRVFQWVSAAGTAGFATDLELGRWATPALLLLVLVMLVGAPSGSTGGGLKLDRAVWLVKELPRELRGRDHASIVWDQAAVPEERRHTIVRHAAALAVLWVATLVVGVALLLLATDAPFQHVVFDATSAMSNVGLDTGVVTVDLSGGAKVVFVALMYLGRLELLVALVLATQAEHA